MTERRERVDPWTLVRRRLSGIKPKHIYIKDGRRVDAEKMRIALIFIYLYACRSAEVLARRSPSDRTKFQYGVYRRDVYIDIYPRRLNGDAYEEVEVLVAEIPIAKKKELTYRQVAVPIEYEPFAREILRYIEKYDDDDPLFNITRQTLHQASKTWLQGLTYRIRRYGDVESHERQAGLHYLRHMRISELVADYHFDGIDVTTYVGWKMTSEEIPPHLAELLDRYGHRRWTRYIEKLFKHPRT